MKNFKKQHFFAGEHFLIKQEFFYFIVKNCYKSKKLGFLAKPYEI